MVAKKLTTRGRGRPTKIDQVIRPAVGTPGTDEYRPERTVAEVVIEQVRAGAYFEEAALAAGVSRISIYSWMKDGEAAMEKIVAGERLSAKERRCADFLNAVEEAQALSEVTDVTRLAQLAAGVTTTRTVTKTRNGAVVEETTTVEQHHPNAQVLEWRLERKFPKRWGAKQAVELTGADGGPIEVAPALPRDVMLDRLERLKAEQDELAVKRSQKAIGTGE